MTYKPPLFLPEGVNNPFLPDRPWTTYESAPFDAKVNLTDCIALVPRNVNEYTDLIHWHELAHVKWTEGVSIFGNTEPGRWDHILREPQVNTLLARELKVDVSRAFRAYDWSTAKVPATPRDAGLFWINIAYYLRDAGNVPLREFAAKLHERIMDAHNGFTCVVALRMAVESIVKDPSVANRQRWAVRLAELFAPPPPVTSPLPDLAPDTGDAIDKAKADDAEKEAREKEARDKEITKALASGSHIENMEIHEHITKTRPGRRISKPGRARDTGIIPVRFDRYCSDKMLFRLRKNSGSILIDCSGSMSWDWIKLQRALETLPNMTVACYQGFHDDVKGRLCVIAKNGRWSDYKPADEPGDLAGNNTVDYQALLWLASQPGPRIWLSDGQICGGNVKNTDFNVNAIMRRGKILRIPTMDLTIAYLNRKATITYATRFDVDPTITRRR